MQGEWQTFENAKFPFIESVELDELVEKDTKLSVPVKTKNASEIHYFLSDSEGQIIRSGILPVSEDFSTIILESSDVKSLPLDPITLKIFAASDDVLRPYEFSAGFLVTESNSLLPESTVSNNLSSVKSDDDPTLIVIVVLSIIGIAMFALKRKMTKKS